jgi:hypothetical protein
MRVVLLATCLLAGYVGVARADALRPAIATPLQLAEKYLAAHKYDYALKQVARAQTVPDKTTDETVTIDQVRAAIDATRGDAAAAKQDYAALIATGALAPAQLTQTAQAEASLQYQAADYTGAVKTITTYLPHDPSYRPILLQSYEQLGNCGALTRAVAQSAKPAETELQRVDYCDAKSKDTAGYLAATEELVKFYPSPAYWSDLLAQLQARPEFADQLSLDLFRLKLAAGVAGSEPEYMEYTQEAVQEGLTNEGVKIIAQGFATGVLGSGPDADRQSRLKKLVATRNAAANTGATAAAQQAISAKDFQTLFGIGFNEVDGGNAKGIDLMAQSIRSGAMPQPGQAELELGIAYREAGQTANANAMFANVQGGDGAAELAKLWEEVK